MVVVIPSYNNATWCEYTLESVRRQKYHNFRVIYLDDSSQDSTVLRVEKYCSNYHMSNVCLVKNKKRVGALANIWRAISLCADNEIVVSLDGDDWFAHDHVLAYLNRVYQDTSVWATYGQFMNWPTGKRGWCRAVPEDVVKQNSFRSYGFWFAQPRTYYAWLAKKVDRAHLIDPKTQDFFAVAGDVALMFPIVEMAGSHIRFIDKILYYRNVATPLNDFKCHQAEQERVTRFILGKSAYEPLKKET